LTRSSFLVALMAFFNESQVGRFNRVIHRLHSMKGGQAPAPQVTPELGHQIILENDRPEFHYLAGSTRYGSGFFTLAADATHFGAIDFSVAAGTGVLAILEQVMMFGQAAVIAYDVRQGAAAVPPGSTGTGTPLDTREATTKKSALLVTANNLSFVGKSGGQIAVLNSLVNTDTEITELRGAVISPGGHITIFGNVINQQIQLRSAVWRERHLEPSET